MICPKCGAETAHVLCDACGVDVVWYRRYRVPGTLLVPETDEISKTDLAELEHI